MKTQKREWKLFDDGDSAIANGTPFRVNCFIGEHETFLYFSSRVEAFEFAQNNPNLEQLQIKNIATCETLYGTID